jgi:DNA (cytosine-5)-methyltransferase 1
MILDSEQFLPVVSLFCGAGGLDTGFLQRGFKPIIALDSNEAACETYKYNYPSTHVIRRDLALLPKGYILERLAELPRPLRPVGVIGGPPCQAFSVSNGHKKPNDPRARLSEHYASLLSELNEEFELDFFVFENVLGLLHEEHDVQFRNIKDLLASAGFWILEGELDAQDFRVAQSRRRLFLVGFNKKKYPLVQFEFPQGNSAHPRTVRNLLEHLPEPLYFQRGASSQTIPFHQNHWCMAPKSKRFRDGRLLEGQVNGRAFRVLKWDRPSWTVAYGHREVHIHPAGQRRLSVYEAMLLQGFPREYRLMGTLSDQIRLVSDAVPPPLASALAESIRDVLPRLRQLAQCRFDRQRMLSHKIFWNSRQDVSSERAPAFLRNFFIRYARKHLRKFPWRRKKTKEFHLLIAEVLLVQTKAEDVARIWPLLIKRYEKPSDLASAKRSDLKALLRPLGLQNQRAKALHTIARVLVKRHQGEVPRDVAQLLSLPHVGLYTAAAVASFSFGKRVPIVDTNVLRVLGRITGSKIDRDLRRSKKIWAFAWSALPEKNVQLHNYGILDFAAQVCTRDPNCSSCPLRRKCAFGKSRKSIQSDPRL